MMPGGCDCGDNDCPTCEKQLKNYCNRCGQRKDQHTKIISYTDDGETMKECKRFNNNGCGKVILDENICEEDNICGFIFIHDECQICENCGRTKEEGHIEDADGLYCVKDGKKFSVRNLNERGTGK